MYENNPLIKIRDLWPMDLQLLLLIFFEQSKEWKNINLNKNIITIL